ncbi:gamma-glutamyl-gamma-aminobutyrate hydrolase family protein [uncultured Friedmanniella sp.]|uniref:gamma-glutamyl-gamma-aminobutyrate hydrolase family protein n=1 Tax=uncultured Friedmanniella sp. TaxID=335381 RepID=UPI0035CC0D65
MTLPLIGPLPLIGLSAYRELAAFGVWHTQTDLLNSLYARSVEAAGGIAVLMPPQGEQAAAVVDRLDGLIITGGSDVEPARYGSSAHPQTQSPRRERDAWELALLDRARAQGVPVLGICRGMQVMAVHAGGTLEQHLPEVVGHDEHSPGGDAFGWVSVTTAAGSLVQALVGEEMQVNCHHHQAVASHPGLVATAHAADGTLESVEDPERPFWLGVQWHPEHGDDFGLFRGLVEAASRRLPAAA